MSEWGWLHPLLPGPEPVSLTNSEHAIGRHELATQRKLVSKQHLRILRNDEGTTSIIDTSVNGTFVNGMRLKRDEPRTLECADVVTLLAAESTEFAFIFVRLDDPRLQHRSVSDGTEETNPLILFVRRAIGIQQKASMIPATTPQADDTPNDIPTNGVKTTPSSQPADHVLGTASVAGGTDARVPPATAGPRLNRADTIVAPVVSPSWQESSPPDRSTFGRLSRPAPPPPKPPRPPPRPDQGQSGQNLSCGASVDPVRLSCASRQASAPAASRPTAAISSTAASSAASGSAASLPASSTDATSNEAQRSSLQGAPRSMTAGSAVAAPASPRELPSWFFADASRTKRGPVSQSDLIELLQGGDIDEEALVRKPNPTQTLSSSTLCHVHTPTRRGASPEFPLTRQVPSLAELLA